MVKGTMFSGESKNIESKVSLPDKSEKYVKTIVAFANTQIHVCHRSFQILNHRQWKERRLL